jgi:hypothetical protein
VKAKVAKSGVPAGPWLKRLSYDGTGYFHVESSNGQRIACTKSEAVADLIVRLPELVKNGKGGARPAEQAGTAN